MFKRKLGDTDIEVSRLCYGSLTISPLQKNLSFEEGAHLIKYAFDKGVNFLDTADLYDNYGHINHFLKMINRHDYVISTKSYAYDTKTAEETLSRALKEMGTDYIDIFMLHEQESHHTLRGHQEALEYFLKMKQQGIIRAVGISTHYIEGVLAACQYPEIEVIHPIINKAGIGIVDGKSEDMLNAIYKAKACGKGVYAMKALGGGHLINQANESLDYVMAIDDIDAIAIGMQNTDEIDYNFLKLSEKEIPLELSQKILGHSKKLHIASWCTGCGSCVERCQQNAIELIDNKAVVNQSKCVLCGYCSKACSEFCIKVI